MEETFILESNVTKTKINEILAQLEEKIKLINYWTERVNSGSFKDKDKEIKLVLIKVNLKSKIIISDIGLFYFLYSIILKNLKI